MCAAQPQGKSTGFEAPETLTMVARTLPTKLGRICEISFKIYRLPRWLEDAVDALGMQRMKSEERRRDGRWGGEAAGARGISL